MSTLYGINISIKRHASERLDAIKRAATDVWSFTDWIDGADDEVTSYAEGSLFCGMTEEKFARRLTHAVWQANEAYCEVCVDATCLENLPYESFVLNEDDYDQWLQGEPDDDADAELVAEDAEEP